MDQTRSNLTPARVFGSTVFTVCTFLLVLAEFGLEFVWLIGAAAISGFMWLLAFDAPPPDA